jgi:hypothetical protein
MSPWLVLLALGAFHGANPGMGWLFAVARGLQERRRAEVWRAIVPLAAGHALAVGLAVGAATLLGARLPLEPLRWATAILLVALGARRLARHGHPRLGGMQVGTSALTIWSCLMATAHGAGLMVVPVLLAEGHAPAGGHASHAANPMAFGTLEAGVAATAIHALGYLVVSALVAVVVYDRLGLRFLRTRWLNLDLLWAFALIVTGVVVLAV